MSPASSGALEVERYIGACLISSNQARSKGTHLSNKCNDRAREQFFQREPFPTHQNHHHLQRCHSVDGWAGGMPLISFANYQRLDKHVRHQDLVSIQQDRRFPLSRLAVHTQGAPLILSNRYNHRKVKNRHFVQAKTSVSGASTGKSKDSHDTISVNSDESSTSSTNSESCLPRIIKPRKRRKKDRKPHLTHPLNGQDDCCFSTDSGSPEIESPSIAPYIPAFQFELYRDFSDYRRVPELVQDAGPKLQHAFEDLEEIDEIDVGLLKDVNDNQISSACQCRYCDPRGQIWDVDRNCYSPFLTTPERQLSFGGSDPKFSSYELSLISSDLIDALSDLSLGRCDHSLKGSCGDLSPPASPRDLEVSTEIVTSHNGHRDIEIKFFSSSAPGKIDDDTDSIVYGHEVCDNDGHCTETLIHSSST